ncbi:DUF305 domain-containing protein [Massilia sp. TN1-12]|uniref:DUF305 domain-containing protein n=1 Tax=Massilia paldalensis TaxID=3377675 RepID=UPI00384E060D
MRNALLAAVVGAATLQPALADAPGSGATAAYEKDYLVFVIDHHFSALRITELAAGTDRTRDAAIQNPDEGTSPTPGYGATPAKATDERIRSLARQDNRVQREEITKAQRFLRDWYGIQHNPVLMPEGRQMIQLLENTPAGAQFDRTFLRTFSNHHFTILAPSVHCQVQNDLDHQGLRRYCENIVVTQKNQINDMREMLCMRFNECGFAPSGRRQEQD